MNTVLKIPLLLGLSIIAFSCKSAPKRQAVSHWDDPAIAKAGWKKGQVYRTVKRGGVSQDGTGYFSLNTEKDNSRVAEAWRNPEYRSKYLAYKVKPGTLFQVTEVRYSRYSGFYSMCAIQLPENPVEGQIRIDVFSGDDLPSVKGLRGRAFQRDPNYLVPVKMQIDKDNQTKEINVP